MLNKSFLSEDSKKKLLKSFKYSSRNKPNQNQLVNLDYIDTDNLSLKRVSSHKSFDLLPSLSSSSAVVSSISETSFISKNSSDFKPFSQNNENFFDQVIEEPSRDDESFFKPNELNQDLFELNQLMKNQSDLSDTFKEIKSHSVCFNNHDEDLFSNSSNENLEEDLDLVSGQIIDDDFKKLTPCKKHKKFKTLLRNYELLKKNRKTSKKRRRKMNNEKEIKEISKQKKTLLQNLVRKLNCFGF